MQGALAGRILRRLGHDAVGFISEGDAQLFKDGRGFEVNDIAQVEGLASRSQ